MSDLAGLIAILKELSNTAALLVNVLEAPTAEEYAAALIPAASSLKQSSVAALSDEQKAAVKASFEALVAAVYPAASDEVAAAKTVEEHLEAIMKFAPVKKDPVPQPDPTPAPEPTPEPVA